MAVFSCRDGQRRRQDRLGPYFRVAHVGVADYRALPFRLFQKGDQGTLAVDTPVAVAQYAPHLRSDRPEQYPGTGRMYGVPVQHVGRQRALPRLPGSHLTQVARRNVHAGGQLSDRMSVQTVRSLRNVQRNRSLVPERYDGRLVETVALRSYGNDVISEQLLFLVQAADYGAHVFLTGRDHFLYLADDHFVQTLLFFLCIHRK